ncbi:MAG: response regulator transcription factor [Flavobacteriales bacterium]|nr:response regulator transcription factor [Flavobacteriales bacterium]
MIKVLLVDDNTIIRKATNRFLPKKGKISVVGECLDGKDVLNFLKKETVDVILMDISMKYVGGIEATKIVKQKYPEVKVIAFSNHTEKSYKDEMFLAGASDYIDKGTEIRVIRKIIKAVVSEERSYSVR